ncbi:restriction endonuclease, SacI family [Halomonas sp. HMF6819]|uniref:restriction endonuclease, SacI family n=1 Tax=Halomonas sp. HMF6819 TaxID=3373085 RepID=UPI0037BCA4AB
MAIRINTIHATQFLREQAAAASPENSDKDWLAHVEHLSELCAAGAPVTHIAFLGACLLAKSLNPEVDLFAFKPQHEKNRGNPKAISLRPLAHAVLVPVSAEFGFSIGATGREPLNNQPYFRMGRLGDDTPIHSNGKEVYRYLIDLVETLSSYSAEEAAAALRAYITVRRAYIPDYTGVYESTVNQAELLAAIQLFVSKNSEGGKRAQAVTAGVLDVYAAPELVLSASINDPSKNRPGDVCVYSDSSLSQVEKAFEVKDKPVSLADIQIFGRNCLSMEAKEAAIVMSSREQPAIDQQEVTGWAQHFGIAVTLFFGWEDFLNQALFWSMPPTPEIVSKVAERVRIRLIEIQVSAGSVERWDSLTAGD